jgi:hypothetical protein
LPESERTSSLDSCMNSNAKAEILHILQTGAMEIEGVLPWSSNYAFLVTISHDGVELPAVYKPRRGERPLWDFPAGTLHLREKAAYIISEELGWKLVPPTVVRDGEYGQGSVQLYIEHDPNHHYFVLEGDPTYRIPLQKMALLDVAINNADRKGGHVMVEKKSNDLDKMVLEPDRIWGIDHGICFHEDYKLRTVIWEFAGEQIPLKILTGLQLLQHKLQNPRSEINEQLSSLLEKNEIIAFKRRVDRLVMNCVFPDPGPGRHYPWPPV